jgi:hypothetical protein
VSAPSNVECSSYPRRRRRTKIQDGNEPLQKGASIVAFGDEQRAELLAQLRAELSAQLRTETSAQMRAELSAQMRAEMRAEVRAAFEAERALAAFEAERAPAAPPPQPAVVRGADGQGATVLDIEVTAAPEMDDVRPSQEAPATKSIQKSVSFSHSQLLGQSDRSDRSDCSMTTYVSGAADSLAHTTVSGVVAGARRLSEASVDSLRQTTVSGVVSGVAGVADASVSGVAGASSAISDAVQAQVRQH